MHSGRPGPYQDLKCSSRGSHSAAAELKGPRTSCQLVGRYIMNSSRRPLSSSLQEAKTRWDRPGPFLANSTSQPSHFLSLLKLGPVSSQQELQKPHEANKLLCKMERLWQGCHCFLYLPGDWWSGGSGSSACRRSMKMVGGSVFSLMLSANFWPGSAWKPAFVEAHL